MGAPGNLHRHMKGQHRDAGGSQGNSGPPRGVATRKMRTGKRYKECLLVTVHESYQLGPCIRDADQSSGQGLLPLDFESTALRRRLFSTYETHDDRTSYAGDSQPDRARSQRTSDIYVLHSTSQSLQFEASLSTKNSSYLVDRL